MVVRNEQEEKTGDSAHCVHPEFPVVFRTTRSGHRDDGVHGATGTLVCGLVILLAVFFTALTALGQEPAHPLKPPDRSSPAAALKTFLDSGDVIGSFLVQDYLPSPSRAKWTTQRRVSIQCGNSC